MKKIKLHVSADSLAPYFVRLGFGIVLVGYGINHYRNFSAFLTMSSAAFPQHVAVHSVLAGLSYLFPALMIVGGVLFATGQVRSVSNLCILAAFGGILGWGGLVVMVSTLDVSGNLMPLLQSACVFLLTYFFLQKKCARSSCSDCSCSKISSTTHHVHSSTQS